MYRCSFILIFLLGCGGPQAARVSGTVTLDDQPLTKGDVTFNPVGAGAVAYGQIDGSGRYTVSTGTDAGLAPGSYIVTVRATEPVPPKSPTEELQFKVLTPEKYLATSTSDLKFEVQAGANDIPLSLSSK